VPFSYNFKSMAQAKSSVVNVNKRCNRDLNTLQEQVRYTRKGHPMLQSAVDFGSEPRSQSRQKANVHQSSHQCIFSYYRNTNFTKPPTESHQCRLKHQYRSNSFHGSLQSFHFPSPSGLQQPVQSAQCHLAVGNIVCAHAHRAP